MGQRYKDGRRNYLESELGHAYARLAEKLQADRQKVTELFKVYKVDSVMRVVYLVLLGYSVLLPFYFLPAAYLLGIKIPIAKYLPLFLILFLAGASFWKSGIKQDFLRENLNKYIVIYCFLTLLSGLGTDYYPVSILKAIYYGVTGALVYFIIKTAYKKIKYPVYLTDKDLNFFLSMSCLSFFINMFFWDVFNHPTMRIFFWSFVGLLS